MRPECHTKPSGCTLCAECHCTLPGAGSMHSLVASPYKSAYNAAKHGEQPALINDSGLCAAVSMSMSYITRFSQAAPSATPPCQSHGTDGFDAPLYQEAAALCDHNAHTSCRGPAAGIAGFTKTVALETARGTNVTCNAICPGYMFTALVQNQLEDTARIRGITKVPSRSKFVAKPDCGSLFGPIVVSGPLHLEQDGTVVLNGHTVPGAHHQMHMVQSCASSSKRCTSAGLSARV